jgi:hypothetical protein
LATILWSFMSQRGCYEPALPIVGALVAAGHRVVGITQSLGRVNLPWEQELVSDHFLPAPEGLPTASVPPASLEEAIASKVLLAGWHMAEVEYLVAQHNVDLVLADGFRLGAGLAAEKLGLPWLAYTHHYFDEAGISEGMVEYYCQRFGRPDDAPDIFAAWWPTLLESLGAPGRSTHPGERCWWNLSSDVTVVLGLPELNTHRRPAPAYVHRVGPTLWRPAGAVIPQALSRLGQDRPAVLVAMSTNAVADDDLVQVAALLSQDHDVVLTAGARSLPSMPAGVLVAGDVAHGLLMDRMAAVVCSAGYGTVTRAACAGVPVVAVPRMGDQFLVADAVQASGLGRWLAPDEEPHVIAGAVTEICEAGPGRAQELRAAGRRSSAIENAVSLVKGLVSR